MHGLQMFPGNSIVFFLYYWSQILPIQIDGRDHSIHMMRRLTTTAASKSSKSLPSIKLVSVEGNIGAGKTTLLKLMKSRSLSYVRFLDEPVGVWESIKNEAEESLLQVYYKDPKRWSYTFQSCALLSRYQTLASAVDTVVESSSSPSFSSSSSSSSSMSLRSSESDSSPPECVLIIAERCLDTDYHVFTKMLCDEGCIDKMEYDIYNRLYQHLQSESIPLSGIIHVDTDPNECLSRIKGEIHVILYFIQVLSFNSFISTILHSREHPAISVT